MLAPTSFWNQRLPGDVPIDPEGSTYVASIVGGIKNVNLLYRNTSVAIFYANENTPRQKIWLDVKDGNQPKLRAALESVPIPSELRSPGPHPGDQQTCIVCPRADGSIEYFEMHQMHQIGVDAPLEVAGCSTLNESGWHCDAGSAIKDLRLNPGYVTEVDWPGGVDIGAKGSIVWGCSASKTITYPHVIQIAEAQRLYIPHALRLALPKSLHKSEFRWPALASDGESTNSNHPPTGCIFTFDSDDNFADVSDPFIKAVCVAIRDYGWLLTDSSGKEGGGAAFKAETQATIRGSQAWGTDAWKGPEDKIGSPGAILREGNEGTPENETALLGNQIPLNRLQVVDASYRPSGVAPGVML